jgi:RHS repeat-associated protein
MKTLASFKFPDFQNLRERSAQFPTPNAQRYRVLVLGALLLTLGANDLRAQVGSNNPTGVSGIFNGNITTGCSYDPYTGNATRSITDIAVSGAVGQYPLALVRTYNSRTGVGGAGGFGVAGQWTHNYSWAIESSAPQNHPFTPSSYIVDYPDGRKVTFAFATGDPYYRGPLGVRERFQTPPQGGGLAYLILPDGGKVEFNCEELDSGSDSNEVWWWVFTATAIIDPYGLRTTFTYNGDGSLQKVTEPAGRYLQFSYSGGMISQVTEVINGTSQRSVLYYYINSAYPPGTTVYSALNQVAYFGQWNAKYKYCAPNNANNANGIPLLWTADDPMYPGPMHRIAYTYRTANNYTGNVAVYGQTSSERYWDGVAGDEGTGAAVTTLTVPSATVRTETRADGKTRTFNYDTSGYLLNCTDFMTHSASQTYDANRWINSVTDRNTHTTNCTSNALTGLITQVQYPLTQGDTPGQSIRPTVNYTYGSASCADTNNQDPNNPYYVCTATDEGGHVTQFWRDVNKRVTRIDYPDGGYETFAYDAAHFYKLRTHLMTTGGTETFAYDTSNRLQSYSNPDANPSIQYSYDALDRVSGVTDALNQNTGFTYDNRGQVTLITLPWYNGVHYTITNFYNPDGTLQYRIDELNHRTNYTYDDYRRLKTVTTPVRGYGDNGTYTTQYFYDLNGNDGSDRYYHTDSNVTFVTLPSGKRIKTVYDDNRRKSTVTVSYPTIDAATTTYIYDNASNLTQVKNPRNYPTTTGYDERNRPSSITDALNRITSFTYDTAGHKKTITRPNGQVITYVSFDAMNRVLQQNVTQTPTGLATSNFTYYPSGLLNTMQDPHLSSGSDNYTYTYDLMGRKKKVTYPLDSYSAHSTEQWSYDTDGRLYQFTNRGGYVQTFSYDQLNHVSGFTWNDGITPGVTFGYDAASRLTSINNVNANITRVYYNDNLLQSETESILSGGYSKTATYTYDADGNRASTTYPAPENYSFGYSYNGRNQLAGVNNWATYNYDENGYIGDLTSRVLTGPQNTKSTYSYDQLDRVTWITHTLDGASRGLNYGYQDNTDNRKYVRRTGGTLGDVGDAFNYDLADQATGVLLNVQTPESTPTPAPNITYDSNGNRTAFHPPYVSWQTYGGANDLSQYTTRTILGVQTTAAYDHKGNLTYGFDTSSYVYDAQNRLTNAPNTTIKYDGLNRQVSRTISGATTYSVWDGWNLIEEYQSANSGASTAVYLYGATGLISGVTNGQFAYYFQDASGSTSHVTDVNGSLLEWYRYDLQGAPVFYNASDQQISASAYGVCYLFTGQQWRSELGLYDLRNRFYSPDIGRFLQADPIGFKGDANNLYRYCENNPVAGSDPMGTDVAFFENMGHGWVGVTNPGAMPNGMTYFDFHPANALIFLTLGLVGPGEWTWHNWSSGGFNYLTIPTTPEQDSRILAAFNDRVTNQGDLYSLYMNNCYTAPLDVIADALYSDPSDNASSPGYNFNYTTTDAPNGGVDTLPVVVSAPSVTKNEQAKLGALARLAMLDNPYWGYLPTTITTNWAGGKAGLPGGGSPWGTLGSPLYGGGPIQNSIFGPGNFYSGLDPISAFPGIYEGNPVGALEPGLGCFVAGTPVLMADGSQEPIESIQVGEAVLAWNEETRAVFSTKVVNALHHDEKMQTLFDIELEDGRKFTVNNDHPMYVVEDGDFVFTSELGARFAKGEAITFRDSKNQSLKVASVRMRKQICKVYNLHVEGQGNNGHTYYASGILVHNLGARTGLK